MARKTKSTTASTEQMSLLSRQNSNSTKKKISSYCNPTYRMRKLTNKGGIFVIIWNFLLASVPYYLMEYVPRGLKVGLVAWGFTNPTLHERTNDQCWLWKYVLIHYDWIQHLLAIYSALINLGYRNNQL